MENVYQSNGIKCYDFGLPESIMFFFFFFAHENDDL